jgi:hypothetical protein
LAGFFVFYEAALCHERVNVANTFADSERSQLLVGQRHKPDVQQVVDLLRGLVGGY